jgi:parallel beta-helix repeat protein
MTKKSVSLGLLTLLALVILSGYSQVVFANPLPPPPILNICIRSDGTIDPPTVPIQRSGNVYTFTSDITNATIEIQRNNTIINGAGHTLRGNSFWNTAINLTNTNNNLIKNLKITDYDESIHLNNSTNITILNNTMQTSGNIMLESSENNQIIGNNITGQDKDSGYGIILKDSNNNLIAANNFKDTGLAIWSTLYSKNNTFYYNNFLNITDYGNRVVGYIEEDNFEKWSNNSEGNYWSNYNGVDVNNDGIGDTPYVIDQKRQDPYPLMATYNITNYNIQINGPIPTDEKQQNQTTTIIIGTSAAITIGACTAVYLKKYRQENIQTRNPCMLVNII